MGGLKKMTNQLHVAVSVSSFAESDASPMDILKKSGVKVTVNPFGRRLTESEIISHLNEVDGLLAGLEPLNRKVLETAPQLKAIARIGIGVDNIDLEAAEEFGKIVSNTPDGPTEAVAEMCLSVILSLGRKLLSFNKDLHAGIWKKQIGTGLKGTKVLFIGYGRIGRKFADHLRYFGAEILVVDPALTKNDFSCNERLVSLSTGLKEAQVITLHASGEDVILGESDFQLMQPGMIILNSARAGLVDEEALLNALDRQIVTNVWLDAFWKEPYNGRLLEYEQALLTPHVCTYTSQCRRSMEVEAVKNLMRDLEL